MLMTHKEYKNATKRTRDVDSLDELFNNLHADIMADKPLTVEELLRGIPTDAEFRVTIMRDAVTIDATLKKM